MRYLKRFVIMFSLMLVMFGAAAVVTADAQRRVYRRPVIIYHQPFYHGWGFGYDPYFYDPYLQARHQRYYRENELRDARRELAIHEEKYRADGVITEKEREQLADDRLEVSKALGRLDRYGSRY
jgi:hypothetical protein